jgi:4-amino-4-deoxy-L-arabinose transferase-like glycosyltransferase
MKRASFRESACGMAIVAAFAGWLFLDRLGERDLWSSHEGRAAQNAQRFLDDGGWGPLRLYDDRPEYQKPPLYYWLVAVAAWCRGGTVDALAVRLPAALAGILTVLAVYRFLAGRGRPVAACIAAGVLASANHFTWLARTGRIDTPLTLAVTLAVLSLAPDSRMGNDSRRRRSWLIGSLAIAAGILLKGPLGLILPLTALIAMSSLAGLCEAGFTEASYRRAGLTEASYRRIRPIVGGLAIVASLTLPWFIVAHVQSGGEFTRVFFWYHHVQRATGGAETLATHPWWFYAPRLLVDWLPWSIGFPAAVWIWIRNSSCDRDARLGLVWAGSLVLLLSCSRFKRADYLLPAYPGVAIWLGCALEQAYFRTTLSRQRAWLASGVVMAVVIAVAWGDFERTIVPRLDADREKHSFAAAIRTVAPRPTQILFFRVEDHLLAFHLGRPINTFMEWENLDIWTGRPGPHFVLMPAEWASQWQDHVTAGTLEELLRYEDRTDRCRPRGLVLMRTHPATSADE